VGVLSPKIHLGQKAEREKGRETKAERTKQRGVTDRKEKLKTAGSSLLEYGAGIVRCEDKKTLNHSQVM